MSILFLLTLFVSIVTGDNRELVPLDAPSNLTLLALRGRQVLIEWGAVDPQTVRGNFRGYLVRMWNNVGSQVYAFPPEVTRVSVEFFPFSKNFVTVSARNEKYVGPPSEAISFDAPQIEPNAPSAFDLFPLSSKSVLLRWGRPLQPNGVLLGYKIHCAEMGDDGELTNRNFHEIRDPEKVQAKLTGLKQGVKYQLGISAINCVGESQIQTAEVALEEHTPEVPSKPSFLIKINYTLPIKDKSCQETPTVLPIDENEDDPVGGSPDFDYYDYLILNETKKSRVKVVDRKTTPSPELSYDRRCLVKCMILWIPDVRNNPGEYFYVRYKVKGERDYQVTEPELSEDFLLLYNFDACKNHEFILVAVDGEFSVESDTLVTPTKIG